MKKVLLFGTFDILHPGHLNLFSQAKRYGKITVVLARDKTIENVKKKKPVYGEDQRKAALEKLGIDVVLGSFGDKYKIIETLKPDIICLGYDQMFFTKELESELNKRNINAKIVKLNPYKEHVYKSSKLRKHLDNKNRTNRFLGLKISH